MDAVQNLDTKQAGKAKGMFVYIFPGTATVTPHLVSILEYWQMNRLELRVLSSFYAEAC